MRLIETISRDVAKQRMVVELAQIKLNNLLDEQEKALKIFDSNWRGSVAGIAGA